MGQMGVATSLSVWLLALVQFRKEGRKLFVYNAFVHKHSSLQLARQAQTFLRVLSGCAPQQLQYSASPSSYADIQVVVSVPISLCLLPLSRNIAFQSICSIAPVFLMITFQLACDCESHQELDELKLLPKNSTATAMAFKTEWFFDTEGKPLNDINSERAHIPGAIRVGVMTLMQAIAITDTLQPQVEALYAPVLAAMKDAPVTAASVTESIFAIKEEAKRKGDNIKEAQDPPSEERSFVFFAYWAGDDALDAKPIGFSRVFEETYFSAVVGSPLVVDLSLSLQQEEVVHCALFTATQATGEALAQKLLVEKRLKAEIEEDESKPVPTSTSFWRSVIAATEFAKSLLTDHSFVDEKSRVEMSMDLSEISSDQDQEPVFPIGLDVKPLDLNDATGLSAVYEVIKLAFGPNPASFEAWKIHYAQQPRFAPELSFVAWDGDEPVAAIALERIVESEGGGEDEIPRLYGTNGKLLAEKKAASEAFAASTEELVVNEELQKLQLGDPMGTSATLEFAPDFDERKARITQEATVAYVCGAATKAEYRGKGLASGLLQRAFRKAAKLTPPLHQIVLGTDFQNKSALRAYARAGMAETRSFSSGMMVTKTIPLVHP